MSISVFKPFRMAFPIDFYYKCITVAITFINFGMLRDKMPQMLTIVLVLNLFWTRNIPVCKFSFFIFLESLIWIVCFIFAVGIPHPYIHWRTIWSEWLIFLYSWCQIPWEGRGGWRIRGRRAGGGVVEKGNGNRRVTHLLAGGFLPSSKAESKNTIT